MAILLYPPGLQYVPNIRDLHVSDAFNDLFDGAERLKVSLRIFFR